MNAAMRAIDKRELGQIIADDPGREVILDYATFADPLFVGEIGTDPIVIVAFIPLSALSDIAYAWVHVLPKGQHYKHAIARLFLRWRPIVHTRYKKLIAHCSTKPEHLAWIRFSGARLLEKHNGVIKFVMEG